jgi:hypothetical protein
MRTDAADGHGQCRFPPGAAAFATVHLMVCTTADELVIEASASLRFSLSTAVRPNGAFDRTRRSALFFFGERWWRRAGQLLL